MQVETARWVRRAVGVRLSSLQSANLSGYQPTPRLDVQSARKTIQLCYGFVGALVLRSLPVTVRCAIPAVHSEPRLIIRTVRRVPDCKRNFRAPVQVAPVPYPQRERPKVMVAQAKRIGYVAPAYPRKALEEGLSGSVTVDFIVDAKGEQTELRVADAKPSGVFDQAALEAVKH
jgi:hypothetical protein